MDFINLIKQKIRIGSTYTVFVKVRYNYDSFCMAGSQFGFVFSSNEVIATLYSSVISRITQYMGSYNLSEDSIFYIQLSFIQQDRKLLSEVSLIKPFYVSNYENNLIKDVLIVPISVNRDSIGKPLGVAIVNGFITAIDLIIRNNRVNFMSIILNKAKILKSNHRDKITSFDKNFKFYLLKDKFDYILAIKFLSPSSIEKIRYSLDGIVISHVIDRVVNNFLIRSIDGKEIVFKNNNLISSKQNIRLKPIDNVREKALFVENNNIGAIEIETSFSNDNSIKVYALGF